MPAAALLIAARLLMRMTRQAVLIGFLSSFVGGIKRAPMKWEIGTGR